MRLPLALLPLVATGCWKLDLAELPPAGTSFAPDGVAVDGWVVSEIDLDLRCPDGEEARFVLAHPAQPDGPVPVAVLYHSGSFDYVIEPAPATPLEGPRLQEVARLSMPFSVRMAYATLGMFPSPLAGEGHSGTMGAALVDRGYALVVPTNCWADYWHNEPGAADNDFEEDFFFRAGRAAAEWPVRMLGDQAFRDALSIELPFEPSTDPPVAVGFGEGGRAIGEVLGLDDDQDGNPDWSFSAIVVDSHAEDLTPWADTVEQGPGLQRIFQDGDFDRGSLFAVQALPPTAWVYSPVDNQLPEGSQDRMLARLDGNDRHQVFEQAPAMHVFSNNDAALAQDVLDFLLP